ncbi:MarR family winged helix-turn-helix transcriptional regulator [Variovorax sp. Root434]|uniref:MarR family winged helix-turn-helix transcriptional regulator n=1 Tax=Variovorax sp. Root434 TaxID=1736536 RepID=UPI0006FF3664|nr:MarR family transcriptional regulator [Variovorax sp. Root434]KQX21319.1 hypothetical protein ASD05_17280 [Variovorax sp. Root434]
MTAEFEHLPGYQVRRLHQIAVALFLEETKLHGITPVQYGALAAVAAQPGIDQRGLARAIGIDTSTIGSVVDRLEARGLMTRNASPDDRRVRLLTITPEGESLLSVVEPGLLRTQERLLAPLPADQQADFMKMLMTLVHGNSSVSRAPSSSDGPAREILGDKLTP